MALVDSVPVNGCHECVALLTLPLALFLLLAETAVGGIATVTYLRITGGATRRLAARWRRHRAAGRPVRRGARRRHHRHAARALVPGDPGPDQPPTVAGDRRPAGQPGAAGDPLSIDAGGAGAWRRVGGAGTGPEPGADRTLDPERGGAAAGRHRAGASHLPAALLHVDHRLALF